MIPKDILIVRCYYEQELVAPETTFGFDINGSGFTESFHQMIKVDPDALDVEVRDLRLVTTNQIHGLMVVGPDATTQYIYPKILIRSMPVFKAPEPFGVVRPGEILDIELIRIDETGQSGRFRILTNLDSSLFRKLRISPTTEHLDVTLLPPQLPFYVEGHLEIGPGVHSGEYGLIAFLGTHELFRKNPLVDVVRPNVGHSGSIENVSATERTHRPGDLVELVVNGSGFSPGDVRSLRIRVNALGIETNAVTYVSPGKLQVSLQVPANAPVGVYGITIEHNSKVLYQKKTVFGIVPPNWLGGVQLTRALSPGQSGTVQILGRDLSPDFVKSLQIESDEAGLQLTNGRLQDSSTIVADISISTGVAPGDYLLHITRQGQPVRLPGGSIIKINP
ncbi:MAG: hypothetical protein WC859_03880 [Elusimicrobiota bacterium]